MISTIAALAVFVGLILLIVGGIWFIVEAFRESILWGIAVILLPIVDIVFLILHWRRAREPFFLQLWGVAIILISHMVLGASLPF